jgi:hypothetical protein
MGEIGDKRSKHEKKPEEWTIKEGGILEPDRQIELCLEALRHHVENINKSPDIKLVGGNTFKQKNIKDIYTDRVGPWEFGYRLEDFTAMVGDTASPMVEDVMVKTLFIKVHGGIISEVAEPERKAVVTAALNAMFDQGNPIDIDLVASDCLMIKQAFVPMFLHEKNPNLIVPGGPKDGKSPSELH